ncbi:MAG: CvpA family protein [Clostridia bacterium]|nr:CvpA family protein [Clostridia bacterium]
MNLSALCAGGPVGYILDAIILVGLIVYMIICGKRGFVKMIFQFASGIVALILAISLAKVVVSATGMFGLLGALTDKFAGVFAKSEGFNVELAGQDLKALLETKDMVAIIATMIVKKYAGVEFTQGETLATLAGSTVAELLCTLIAGVVLFFVLKIVFKLLSKVLTAIFDKITLLGKVNSILGVVLGFLEGVFVISVIISVLTLIPSAAITNFFESSIILRLIYNRNPIVWMLGLFL